MVDWMKIDDPLREKALIVLRVVWEQKIQESQEVVQS